MLFMEKILVVAVLCILHLVSQSRENAYSANYNIVAIQKQIKHKIKKKYIFTIYKVIHTK